MDGLVTRQTEERRAKDLFACLVDQNFHEPERFALFKSAPSSLHLGRPAYGGTAGFGPVRLGYPDGGGGGMGVKGGGGNAVRPPPLLVIENIRSNDLEIVVGRVSKGPATVAVTQRPDTRHIC